MPIIVTCPRCDEQFPVPTEYAGRIAKCPSCDWECAIPGERLSNSSSLIRCKDCGREISHQAKTCPNCGAPSPAQKMAIVAKGLFGLSAGLLILGCTLPFAAIIILFAIAALGGFK